MFGATYDSNCPQKHAKMPSQNPKVLPTISIPPPKKQRDFPETRWVFPDCWRRCLLFNSLRCHKVTSCVKHNSRTMLTMTASTKNWFWCYDLGDLSAEVSAVLESIQQSIQVQLQKKQMFESSWSLFCGGQWSNEGKKVATIIVTKCWFKLCFDKTTYDITTFTELISELSIVWCIWVRQIICFADTWNITVQRYSLFEWADYVCPSWLQSSAIFPNCETKEVSQPTLHGTKQAYWFQNQLKLWSWSIHPRSVQILFDDAGKNVSDQNDEFPWKK